MSGHKWVMEELDKDLVDEGSHGVMRWWNCQNCGHRSAWLNGPPGPGPVPFDCDIELVRQVMLS